MTSELFGHNRPPPWPVKLVFYGFWVTALVLIGIPLFVVMVVAALLYSAVMMTMVLLAAVFNIEVR